MHLAQSRLFFRPAKIYRLLSIEPWYLLFHFQHQGQRLLHRVAVFLVFLSAPLQLRFAVFVHLNKNPTLSPDISYETDKNKSVLTSVLPDNWLPFLPQLVSSPLGRFLIKSYALASFVAFSIAFITDDDVGFVGLIIDLVTA